MVQGPQLLMGKTVFQRNFPHLRENSNLCDVTSAPAERKLLEGPKHTSQEPYLGASWFHSARGPQAPEEEVSEVCTVKVGVPIPLYRVGSPVACVPT